jgi:conjugal transfer pilus assembly protein TraA
MKKLLLKGLALFGVFAAPAAVMAGTGGTEFDAVWTMLTDWIEGSLGRILSGLLVLVGVAAGIARQSLFAFVIGIGGGIGLFYAPTVINNTMTAVLPVL